MQLLQGELWSKKECLIPTGIGTEHLLVWAFYCLGVRRGHVGGWDLVVLGPMLLHSLVHNHGSGMLRPLVSTMCSNKWACSAHSGTSVADWELNQKRPPRAGSRDRRP